MFTHFSKFLSFTKVLCILHHTCLTWVCFDFKVVVFLFSVVNAKEKAGKQNQIAVLRNKSGKNVYRSREGGH